MDKDYSIPHAIYEIISCPICYSDLEIKNYNLKCKNETCGKSFPIIDKIPVLITENYLFAPNINVWGNSRHPLSLRLLCGKPEYCRASLLYRLLCRDRRLPGGKARSVSGFQNFRR